MQTVTLSEFCRIVKKVSEKEHKGKLSLAYMGENHGTCEDTGKQHGGIPRYIGSGMYEKCGSELENLTITFACIPYTILKKWDKKGVILRQKTGEGFLGEFRDPFVWRRADTYYLLVGTVIMFF